MNLNETEKMFLLEALKNYQRGRHEPIHWRVGIRGRFGQTPSEVQVKNKAPLVNGFTETSWLNFKRLDELVTRINEAFGILRAYLESKHIEGLDWSRTNTVVDPHVFLSLGFVFITSKMKYSRIEAEKQLEDWTALGLDCFILPELDQVANLYELAALELVPKYAKAMDTVNLPRDEHSGAIYGEIKDCIADKNIVGKAEEEIGKAFSTLESEGLAVIVEGVHLCWSWRGIILTREGTIVAEDLKFRIRQQAKEDKKPKAGISYLVKCPVCRKIFFMTTDMFDPDRAVRGYDLDFLPKFKKLRWSKPFTNDAIGQNIICNCGAFLVGMDNRFLDGVLIDPADHTAEESEEESDEKINNEELLKLTDEGLSQTKIAEIFKVSRQAIHKRLRALKGDSS